MEEQHDTADTPDTASIHIAAQLPPGVRVRVTVESLDPAQAATVEPVTVQVVRAPGAAPVQVSQAVTVTAPARAASPPVTPAKAAPATRRISGAALGLAAALAVYLLVRVIGLTEYPIYFFTDEAIHTVLAADLVDGGGRVDRGEWLPAYFKNGMFYNLSFSVYAQVLPYLLFGKSILVTRLTSVLITAAGALALGLIARRFLRLRLAWLPILLLSITPAWFLHSRTAFETVESAACYAIFLYFYLRYRDGEPRALYAACVAGALTFYAYTPGQMLMALTGVLLTVVHLRYHWAQRATAVRALVLLLALSAPFVRFQLTHQSDAYRQLRVRESYWLNDDLPLSEKVLRASAEYVYALSPAYWHFPNTRDLKRHVMGDYGHMLWPTLPFIVLGILLTLSRARKPAYNTLLIALISAPVAALVAEAQVPRVMAVVVPATLLCALGLDAVLGWLQDRARLAPRLLGAGAFAVLAGTNVYMLQDALRNGPLWHTDYGLGGMQYGAQQLFAGLVSRELTASPQRRVVITPNWANGADIFPRFFLPRAQQPRVQMLNIDYFLFDKRDLNDEMRLVMIADEYARARNEPKFGRVDLLETIPYPDGSPGFFVTRVAYSNDIDQIFAAERLARQQPVLVTTTVAGESLQITHSQLGAGQASDLFDGDSLTLVRGLEANPLLIDIAFPTARPVATLSLHVGTMRDFDVTVLVYAGDAAEPARVTQRFEKLPADPTVELSLPALPAGVNRLRIEIGQNDAGATAQIHVRDVSWR